MHHRRVARVLVRVLSRTGASEEQATAGSALVSDRDAKPQG